MLEKQNFYDLNEHEESFGDPRSWLSGEDQSSPQQSHFSLSNSNGSNFDRVLYQNLIDVVPLVESLMDQKSKTLFTRRAPLIYTKTPTKESNPKKGREAKGKKIAQLIPSIKQTYVGDIKRSKDGSVDDFSLVSTMASTVDKDREELVVLQEQVKNLQPKLLEKDELLKSTETSMSQITSVHAKIDELECQVAEKESLIKSAHSQLADVNVKLTDKQAALEQIQCEVRTSNRKVEDLRDEIESLQGEKVAFMLLFESLLTHGRSAYAEDNTALASYSDQLPCIDDMDEKEIQEMEEARGAYVLAVAAAKENHDEELLLLAAQARQRLQSYILGPETHGL